MEFPEVLTELSADDLAALRETARTELSTLIAVAEPTEAQVAEGEALEANINSVGAELSRREDITNRAAGLRDRFAEGETEQAPEAAAGTVEEPVEDEPEEVEGETETAPAEAAAETASTATAPAAVAAPTAASLAHRVARPAVPVNTRRLSLTASSDVPGYSTGTPISDVDALANAILEKFNTFPEPTGDGSTEDLRKFGLARASKNFPSELTIQDHFSPDQTMEVLNRAVNERNVSLTGNSLTASGGWCAPSEVVYDLCDGETTEGILSLPEVALGRGGLKYTMGPDWSDIYGSAAFFAQTEAQAIAGTTKGCFEVTCPTFQEVRLDVVGFCVKAPVLTHVAYPELIQRWLRGVAVAHQHKKNARRVSALQTLLGSAVTSIDAKTTAGSLLGTLDFLATRERSIRRWSPTQTMEVVLPMLAKPLLKQDYRLRNTVEGQTPVTDANLIAEMAALNLAPQFIYGYQDLASNTVAYPSTFEVMMYKAGTFVEGTSDVLNIGTLYDAASLAGNIYTAAFFEEGQAFLKMCYGGLRTSIAVCSTGRLGALDLTCP